MSHATLITIAVVASLVIALGGQIASHTTAMGHSSPGVYTLCISSK